MALAGLIDQLERQEGEDGLECREHLGAREMGFVKHGVQRDASEVGEKEKEATERGVKGARRKVEGLDISLFGANRCGNRNALLVGPAGEFGETVLSEDTTDHGRREWGLVVGEGSGDVIDGEVLFAQGEDLIVERLGAGMAGARSRGCKEVEGWFFAELGA